MSIHENRHLFYIILFCLIIISTLCLEVSFVRAMDTQVRQSGRNDEQSKIIDRDTEKFFDPGEKNSAASTDASDSEPAIVPGAAPDWQLERLEKLQTSTALRSPLFKKSLFEWFNRLQPNQGGLILISILVTIIVAFDFKKYFSRRNADLLLLLPLSFLLVDVIRFATGLDNPTKFTLSGIVFLGIFVLSALLLIRSITGGLSQTKANWAPNVSKPLLTSLLILLLVSNTFLALVRAPDDCGYYTNLGAARMLETGKFPYGDPELQGGAAATYGPILYLSHIPFQLGIAGIKSFVFQQLEPSVKDLDAVDHPDGAEPPLFATKLTLLFFHFLGVFGLLLIGRRLGGLELGLGLACLYTGSAYVQGIGGERYFITGMTFISHIAPAALTILAFAALNRPLLSGALLATSAGTLFYPTFFFPLWLGYYFWKGKEWIKFALGFLLICAIILTFVLLITQSQEGESVLKVLHESTVGHQEAQTAYGSSTFSFWGTHPRLAAFWQKPLVHGMYLLKPTFILFAIFVGTTFFMARGRSIQQLAFLTASIAIAIQLWKSHAGGTYVEWYYPFFLIGLLAHQDTSPRTRQMRGKPEETM